MNKEKQEIRSFIGGKCKPVFREAKIGEIESRTIEGYAIVYTRNYSTSVSTILQLLKNNTKLLTS